MIVPAVENTFVGLKQTVCFDLRGSARAVGKISVQEWLTFLKVDVGIDMTTVEQALQHTITGGLFVTMNTEDQYKVVLGKAEAGVAWSKQGGAMVYGWSAGEEVTSLNLNNVFSNSDMEAIRLELSKCGKILTEHCQYYKDCPTVKTGVITVKMRLRPQAVVPTYLFEERVGNTVQVFSDRHSKLCHRCLEHGHLTAFCRKPVKSRQAASKSKTWAMVASAAVPDPVAAPVHSAVSDVVDSGAQPVELAPPSPPRLDQEPEEDMQGYACSGLPLNQSNIPHCSSDMIIPATQPDLYQEAQSLDNIEVQDSESVLVKHKRKARSISPKTKKQLEEKKTRVMVKSKKIIGNDS
jgi:hypothetical protein